MPETSKRCINCGRVIPSEEMICLSCGSENEMQTFRPRVVTNGDRIRSMTDEELAHVMQGKCAYCAYTIARCTERECKDGVYEWLKQEVQEDDE